MAKEVKEKVVKIHKIKKWGGCGGGNAVYGIGLIGALIYFLQHAVTFNDGLLGVVKAIFWPAFFVYKAIPMLGI